MIPPAFLSILIDTIAKAIPSSADQDKSDRAASLAMARMMFEAFEATNIVEATQVSRAVAAHLAAMDGFARAADVSLSNEATVRLRVNALAASRLADALTKSLRLRHAAAAEEQAKAAGAPKPAALPAERVYHRAELPRLLPELADAIRAASRKAGLRGGTALGAVQPTVFAPG